MNIEEINVVIQDNETISVSEGTPTDISEIMHNEEIRQENEAQRIENEEAREEYIDDLKQRVENGEFDGEDGQPGADGFSPIANVSKSGNTATITITDKTGTTTATVSDANATWGNITGTLSNQTDLKNALDSKADTTDIPDLSNYVTNTDYATINKGGVFKLSGNYKTSISNTGVLKADSVEYSNYGSLNTSAFISKGTLENAITGKKLVSNTDYATGSTGGVIVSSNYYGLVMNSNGTLMAQNLSYSDYTSKTGGSFISKSTLENVITGKGLRTETTMPTPSSSLENAIIRYVGETVEAPSYTYDDERYGAYEYMQGSTYICVENPANSQNYCWELIGDILHLYFNRDVNSLTPGQWDETTDDETLKFRRIADYMTANDITYLPIIIHFNNTSSYSGIPTVYYGYISTSDSTYELKASCGDYYLEIIESDDVIRIVKMATKDYVDGLVGDINTALDAINGEVI